MGSGSTGSDLSNGFLNVCGTVCVCVNGAANEFDSVELQRKFDVVTDSQVHASILFLKQPLPLVEGSVWLWAEEMLWRPLVAFIDRSPVCRQGTILVPVTAWLLLSRQPSSGPMPDLRSMTTSGGGRGATAARLAQAITTRSDEGRQQALA